MLPEMTPKFSNTWHFRYPKNRIQVSGNPFYPISMLQTVKKEVNQGQNEQIRWLIMHVIICDSMRTHILNEQSSQDWNSCLVIFESNISSIFIWVIWLVRVIQMVCVLLVVTQKYLKCARVLKFATRNVVREFYFQDIQVQIRVSWVRFLCPGWPTRSVIVVLCPGRPTRNASRPTIVKIFPILFVRVWKYLVSLSIVCGETIHKDISFSIGLTSNIYMKINIISISYSNTYTHTYCIIIDTKLNVYYSHFKLSLILLLYML
jgi:hypothetical protein